MSDNIGVKVCAIEKSTLEALGNVVLDILRCTTAENDTKRVALTVLRDVAKVEKIVISDNSIVVRPGVEEEIS